MTHSLVHKSFVIERMLDASPAKVYNAFAKPEAKAVWLATPEALEKGTYMLDFKVGGSEINTGGPEGGPIYTYKAYYQDIVPNERIIYTYHMDMDSKRISVSLATVEFFPTDTGTKLVLTENGTYLDDLDTSESREHGTNELIDAMVASLK